MGLRPGWTFVNGKNPETARALLAAADRAGVSQDLVRTTHTGYTVPDEVADALTLTDPASEF